MKTFWIVLLLFCCGSGFAQSKKDIKKHKIRLVQEYVSETKNGKTIKYLDASKEYDKNACLISDVEYRKNGTIKKKEVHKYNVHKDRIETTEYDSVGFVHRIVISYSTDDEKAKELYYNEKGELQREVVYLYDDKELKTERRSTNSKKAIESVRTWLYEFYK